MARAHRDQDAAALRALAPAVEIIRPEYEAGMAFLRLVTEAEGQGEAG
ncbi:MAG: hypothetical protein NTU41_12125 [Chloroflexi bacterium]|nr:hypothetical protein [Chloroflexota bacterium]